MPKFNPDNIKGTFKSDRYRDARAYSGYREYMWYEDDEISDIHARLAELAVDAERKKEELTKIYSDIEDDKEEVSKKLRELELSEPDTTEDEDDLFSVDLSIEHDDWEKEYDEVDELDTDLGRKLSALEDAIESLENIIDKCK